MGPGDEIPEQGLDYRIKDETLTLDNITSSCAAVLPLKASYSRLSPCESFRELVQSWGDAIIKSHGISEQDFDTHVCRTEKRDGQMVEIAHCVYLPDSELEEVVRSIRYRGEDAQGL